MSVSKGSNMMVYIPGDGNNGEEGNLYPIACDKVCSLETTVEFIETTVKDNGYHKTFLPTYVSNQISGNGLVDFSKIMNLVALQKYADARQALTIKMILKEIDNGTTTVHIVWSGTGFFQTLSVNADVSSALTFEYVIQITGKVNIDTITMPSTSGGQPVTNMAVVDRVQFRTTTDQTSYQNDVLIGAELLYLSVEGLGIFAGDGDDEMVGLNSTTGTATWNFKVENLTRIIIIYKK